MFRRLGRIVYTVLWLVPGFLMWASFPPFGEKMDAIFALAPLLWLVRRPDRRRAVRIWFLNGLVFWVASLSWMPAIIQNGGPWPLVALGWFALAAYCALYFWAFAHLASRSWAWAANGGYWRRLVVIVFAEPLLWAGLELVRCRLFGGFAWNLLGVPAIVAGFGEPASLGGVYLVSALVVLVAGTLASVAQRMTASFDPLATRVAVPKWVRSIETLLPFALVWLVYSCLVPRASCLVPHASCLVPRASCLGDDDAMHEARGTLHEARGTLHEAQCMSHEARGTSHEARPLTIALVQRNFPCVFDRSERESPKIVYERLFSAVEPLRPELVILPESALAEIGAIGSARAEQFARYVLSETGAKALLAGGARSDAAGRIYNSAALYTGDAQTDVSPELQVYDKVHLVPFGEYIPFDKTFPALQKLAPVGSCTPGELKLLDANGTLIGVAICYEDTDSAQIRRLAAMGAQLLVFITNDSWFSHSEETLQHAWNSVARSIETGLPVVRVGNSGVTGTILPSGATNWLIGEDSKPRIDAEGAMVDRVVPRASCIVPRGSCTVHRGSCIVPRASCLEDDETIKRPNDETIKRSNDETIKRSTTPYVRFGDTPLAIAFALIVAAIIVGEIRAYLCRRRTVEYADIHTATEEE